MDWTTHLAEQALPATRLASSDEFGWRSMLARLYAEPAEAEFTTVATGDHLVVMQVTGHCLVEVRKPGGWVSADYRPGIVGLTAPGSAATLRWRDADGERNETLHMHLHADVMAQTTDGLTSGRPFSTMRDALHVDDPVLRAICRAIHAALVEGADPLVGDSLAHGLAARLAGGAPATTTVDPATPTVPPSDRFAPVIDYMHENLTQPVLLDDLAAVAHMSTFHFLRAFRNAVGMTPRRYLAGLRLDAAARLLRSTDRSVTSIIGECGYASAGNFAAAFRRRFTVSPSEFRSA